MVPHPPLHPAGSVESIAHALNRLAQRQNERKYATWRPVVGALKAASQPSPVYAQPSTQDSASERIIINEPAGADIDDNNMMIAANSNNSNSNHRGYATSVPTSSTIVDHVQQPSPIRFDQQSYSTYSESCPPTSRDGSGLHSYIVSSEQPTLLGHSTSAISQVTPNSGNACTSSDHTNTHFSTHPQSFKDHHSFSVSSSVKAANGSTDCDGNKSSKRRYGTAASLDLLMRIQMHNKAISHYIDMQRQHHSPSIHTNPSPANRKQPIPSSSSSHSHTTTPAPTFKFVVPCPPSTPKPNSILKSHRVTRVIGTTPIAM